ncbi:hypothetical protein WJX72_006928 [[Myrmecia] bisecta]|uniref:Uncharacterized protein n=1 Tax=[Myrmecia] bisecta TaxID=41462 RepID=A0AAW1P989_9CHLO
MGNFCSFAAKLSTSQEVVSCGEDGSIALLDWQQAAVVQCWRGHERSVNRVAWVPSCQGVASASRDTSVRLWHVDKPEAVLTCRGHVLSVTGLAAFDELGWICSGARDCSMRLWDLSTGQQLSCSTLASNMVTFMRAIPGEPAVLQSSEDLQLRVWDLRTMQPAQATDPPHVNIPLCCDCSPDGLYFVTSCNGFDGSGCEAPALGSMSMAAAGPGNAAGDCSSGLRDEFGSSATGSSSGLRVASGSTDRTVRIWDAGTGQQLAQERLPAGHDDAAVTALAVLQRSNAGLGSAHQSTSVQSSTQHEHSTPSTCLCAATFAGDLQIWNSEAIAAADGLSGSVRLNALATTCS